MLVNPSQVINTKIFPYTRNKTDKINLVNNVLNIIPEDFEYIYFDGEVDSSSLGFKLVYAIAVEALNENPDDLILSHSLGLPFIQMGDYQRALICYENLKAKFKNSHVVWGNIAWSLMKSGDYTKALEASKMALSIEPDIPNFYDTHAAILAYLGRIDESIHLIEKSMTLPESNYQAGMLFEKKGDMGKAKIYWHNYLSMVENQYGHRKAITRVLNKLSFHDGQEIEIPNFISINKESIIKKMKLAQNVCSDSETKLLPQENPESKKINPVIGRFIEAICDSYTDILEEFLAIKLASTSERIILSKQCNFISLANLLQLNFDNVERWLEESSFLFPDNPDTKNLQYSYYVLKASSSVVEKERCDLLKSAIEIESRPSGIYVQLAKSYYFSKEFHKIGELCKQLDEIELSYKLSAQELMTLKEVRFYVTLWRGLASIEQNRFNETLEIFIGLSEIKPEDPEVKYWLARAYINIGLLGEAYNIFKTINPYSIPYEFYINMKRFLDNVANNNFIYDPRLGRLIITEPPRMDDSASSPFGREIEKTASDPPFNPKRK